MINEVIFNIACKIEQDYNLDLVKKVTKVEESNLYWPQIHVKYKTMKPIQRKKL